MVRQTAIKLIYNDTDATRSIAPYLLNFSYTDNASGQADDLQIQLEDRAHLWEADWLPEKGDVIDAIIAPTGQIELPCGLFDIDEITISGSPSTVSIKGVSAAMATALRGEKNTKAWENIRLKAVAAELAKRAEMKLAYLAKYDPAYKRRDQTEQSDLAFLQDICDKAGLSLKVTDDSLVIFDEEEMEQGDTVATYERGKDNMLSYSFTSKSRDIYRACVLQYKDPKTSQVFKYVYEPPNAPDTGQLLKINERVDDAEEGKVLARKRLREKNLKENMARLTVVGDSKLAAGTNVNIKGFNRFDGKYYITQAKHNYSSSGYTTEIEMHKTLGAYYVNAVSSSVQSSRRPRAPKRGQSRGGK